MLNCSITSIYSSWFNYCASKLHSLLYFLEIDFIGVQGKLQFIKKVVTRVMEYFEQQSFIPADNNEIVHISSISSTLTNSTQYSFIERRHKQISEYLTWKVADRKTDAFSAGK